MLECLEIMFNSINRYISKIFAQQNLKLIVTNRYHKKAKKFKDFKKAVVFKKIALNTRIE
ncbi:hypothetical protein G3141_05585 [Helicobacter pylori]|nr:hypothetical protein [Helicobacter pylori]